jgi:hypothetical protein
VPENRLQFLVYKDMEKKVISKFYRLQMTDHLKSILLKLPSLDLEETQAGNHIYYAHGNIKIGRETYPCRLRVWIDQNEDMRIALKAPRAKIEVTNRFDSKSGRSEFVKKLNQLVHDKLN